MTFDEMLSEQIKRLPPDLRAQLQSPRRDTSRSLLGGGIGLSRMDAKAAPRRGYPRDFGGRATNVIVQGDQPGPAPAVLPRGMDENALVRQAGFATANSDLAPLLSDWRTTPAAALTAALGGYGRGSYAAQRDLAAGRAEAQKAEREEAQAAARDKFIAQLPPDKRFLAELNPEAFASAEIERAYPKPLDPEVAAQLAQGQTQFEDTAARDREQFAATQALQLQQLAQSGAISERQYQLELAKLKQGGGSAPNRYELSGGVVLDKLTGSTSRVPFDGSQVKPDTQLGKLIAERDALPPDDPRRPAYDAAIAKETTRGDGISLGVDENGNPKVTIGTPGTGAVTTAGQNKISQYRAARENLTAATKDYKDLVKTTGGTIIPGTAEAAALEAAQTRVMMGAKNLYDLGAPTGPDIELLQNMIPSVTGLRGVVNPVGRVDAGLAALEKDIETMTSSVERGYGGDAAVTRPEPTAPAAEADKPLKGPQGYGPGQTLPKSNKDDLTYFGFGP